MFSVFPVNAFHDIRVLGEIEQEDFGWGFAGDRNCGFVTGGDAIAVVQIIFINRHGTARYVDLCVTAGS